MENPEINNSIESLFKENSIVEGIVFEEKANPKGIGEYKSSSPDRKIMLLNGTSKRPEAGKSYKVKIVKDTEPNDPKSGILFVEIIPDIETYVRETKEDISYLGVTLKKAKNANEIFVPKRQEDFINDKEVSLPLQRDIAVSFLAGDPILLEGGTSLGKTTTVNKMAAELNWEVHYSNLNGSTDVEDLMGRYIPNPNKNNPEDPEFIFADGKVTSGLRQEDGKTKIIILDEFNSAAPNILIRLHEVLDALEKGGNIVLSEDASEVITVNKASTKIIAIMNPAGKGYFGREVLDPAQLRRWAYKKLPSELPTETFNVSVNSLFGGEQDSQYLEPQINDKLLLKSRKDILTLEQLAEIPGIQDILLKYKEFHSGVKEMMKNRKIAADQPQPFTYDDRMEPRRVRDFVLRFYNGDINETFQQALKYYYLNKLESTIDKNKVNELLRMVEYTPKASSQRKPIWS